MAKEFVLIQLDEDDIKRLVAEKYNLDISNMTLNVSHSKANQREPEYTSINIKAQKVLTNRN